MNIAVHFELAGGVARSQTAKKNRPHSFTSSKPSRANTAPPHLVSRHHGRGQTPRLDFLDHMIKPVQRICKYYLLLDQLKSRVPSNPHSRRWAEGSQDHSYPGACADADGTTDPAELFSAGQTESLVTHACEVMREVVNSVNDDRRKHEDRWRAFLIASRTVPSTVMSSPLHPDSQLTSEVLMTLGNCLMCGALDVIYHRPTTSTMTKAKYFGAFLYEQGYLAFVKVGKSKAYEPQHWFPLKDFDVFDLGDDDDGKFWLRLHLQLIGLTRVLSQGPFPIPSISPGVDTTSSSPLLVRRKRKCGWRGCGRRSPPRLRMNQRNCLQVCWTRIGKRSLSPPRSRSMTPRRKGYLPSNPRPKI